MSCRQAPISRDNAALVKPWPCVAHQFGNRRIPAKGVLSAGAPLRSRDDFGYNPLSVEE
jgi:hypothetical protein